MNKYLKIILILFSGLVLLSLSFFGGVWAGQTVTEPAAENYLSSEDPAMGELFEPLFLTWDIVHEQFIDQPVDDTNLMRGAISGLLESLQDPYSTYMNPEEYEQLNAPIRGDYTGIGAWVDTTGDFLSIIRPMAGSPAEKAGIKPGDIIIGVDNEDVTGMNPELVLQKILGPADTDVILSIRREGLEDVLEITITRAVIDIPSVVYEMLESDIAYIHLSRFGVNAVEEITSAYLSLAEENPQGLVLDLRNNGGGLLDAAIEVTSLFVNEKVILIEEAGDGSRLIYESVGEPIISETPLVVLINGGTASASEITAGAIQDFKRGILVGTTTFGKGFIQNWIELPNQEGAIRISIARWLTPKGRQINDIGLAPDIVIEYSDEDYEQGIDPQLEKAIELLLSENESEVAQ